MRRPQYADQSEADDRVRDVLAGYRAEGLIPRDFEPSGESERERIMSAHARAYTEWLRRYAQGLGIVSPEEAREAFAHRGQMAPERETTWVD